MIFLQEQSQHQNQPLQHQNPATTSEVRPNIEENVNQSKQFSKPYTIPIKQYPAVESLSNPIPSTTLNSESDKRNSQQQVKYHLITKNATNYGRVENEIEY